MENASKALLMAGTILISICIISTAVYLINRINNTSETYYEKLSTIEITKYNTEITKNFEIINGKTCITAPGIVTLMNLMETPKYKGTTKIVSTFWTEKEKEKILQDYSWNANGELFYYVIKIQKNNNGLINKITIEQTPV